MPHEACECDWPNLSISDDQKAATQDQQYNPVLACKTKDSFGLKAVTIDRFRTLCNNRINATVADCAACDIRSPSSANHTESLPAARFVINHAQLGQLVLDQLRRQLVVSGTIASS